MAIKQDIKSQSKHILGVKLNFKYLRGMLIYFGFVVSVVVCFLFVCFYFCYYHRFAVLWWGYPAIQSDQLTPCIIIGKQAISNHILGSD